MSRTVDDTPTLSVVIATTQPWPEIAGCLASLVGQAGATGAEVIVADATGRGLPGRDAFPEVQWLTAPGGSVFQLRALAMSKARGEIVAVTEDHCRVAPDWCEAIIAAHREHPEAAAIGGVVENGATRGFVDWAHFFIVNGPFMAPIPNGPSGNISLQANVSYKRRALPHTWPALGMMEMLYNRELRRRRERLVADGRIVVEHVQPVGIGGACAAHFHNGRSIAGFRLAEMSAAERLVRLAGCAVLPPVMLWRTLNALIAKRRRLGLVAASVPLLALFVTCHAAGEFAGYVSGAGGSPQHLR
jgi:Glycosyl transferase family 2